MCVIVLQRKCQLAILKWTKVKTLTTASTFFRSCDMTLQKNPKKSRFLDYVKNIFSNYDLILPASRKYMTSELIASYNNLWFAIK